MPPTPTPFFFFFFKFSGVEATVFTLENKCSGTVWPGTLSSSKHPPFMNGGFEMKPGDTTTITAPPEWSGRFWARAGCSFDQSGKGKCNTGDCGGVLQCAGAGGTPPATLIELTLDSQTDSLDFYDVSLVDGYNVPMSITPSGGTGNCSAIPCVSDLNLKCPPELQVKSGDHVEGCKSACMAFNTPEYCCKGAFNDPKICQASKYSEIFKAACPKAYSYAYDDATSTYTCRDANYLITFC